MTSKILTLFAILVVSVKAATALTILRHFPSVATVGINHPCVQYFTLQEVFATGISPSSAILQNPLAFLEQQCGTHLLLQGITILKQQQALTIVQQQIAQELLPILLQQVEQQEVEQQQVWLMVQQQVLQEQLVPILLQQVQQLREVLPILLEQVQQQVLLPYLLNTVATRNPASYVQRQLLPYLFYVVAATNSAASVQHQQLLPNLFNIAMAVNSAAYRLQPLLSNLLNAGAYEQQLFSAGTYM